MPSVRRSLISAAFWCAAATLLVLLSPDRADAYIGPGAGFAFLSSVLTLLTTALLSLGAFLLWPFRKLWRLVRQPRLGPVFARRLIVVGFDGQGADLTERLMSEGQLPNMQRLASAAGYRRMEIPDTTSRAAWLELVNGVGPAESGTPSPPFWRVLGERGIWSAVLRVPDMFPVAFHGAQLSDATVVAVDASAGSFVLYTTRPPETGRSSSRIQRVTIHGTQIDVSLPGIPGRFSRARNVPVRIEVHRDRGEATVTLNGKALSLSPGALSDWVETGSGICRFLLLEAGEHLSLYVTPVNVDPERPKVKVSHPGFYSSYMAKRTGKFATLDLSSAADAVTSGAIGLPEFLIQVDANEREREALFNQALARLRRGSLVCVFDGARRIAQAGGGESDLARLCERNDAVLGRMLALLRPDDLLVVVSPSGVLFSNRRIDATRPALSDLAPTVLRALGVTPPAYMKGAPVFDFARQVDERKPVPA